MHIKDDVEVYRNHCGIEGLNLKSSYGKNVLYYAVLSSRFDREVEYNEGGIFKKMHRDQRSLREESLYIFNVLRGAGARFGSAYLFAQALELAVFRDRGYMVDAWFGGKEPISRSL